MKRRIIILATSVLALALATGLISAQVSGNPDGIFSNTTFSGLIAGPPAFMQSSCNLGCFTQSTAYMVFDTTQATGEIDTATLDVTADLPTGLTNVIITLSSATGCGDGSAVPASPPTNGSDLATLGPVTIGTGDNLQFTSTALAEYLETQRLANETACLGLWFSDGIGAPQLLINDTTSIVLSALDPNAVDFYSFRSGGTADFAMIGLGLLVAVGLLVGTGYTVANRRRG